MDPLLKLSAFWGVGGGGVRSSIPIILASTLNFFLPTPKTTELIKTKNKKLFVHANSNISSVFWHLQQCIPCGSLLYEKLCLPIYVLVVSIASNNPAFTQPQTLLHIYFFNLLYLDF